MPGRRRHSFLIQPAQQPSPATYMGRVSLDAFEVTFEASDCAAPTIALNRDAVPEGDRTSSRRHILHHRCIFVVGPTNNRRTHAQFSVHSLTFRIDAEKQIHLDRCTDRALGQFDVEPVSNASSLEGRVLHDFFAPEARQIEFVSTGLLTRFVSRGVKRAHFRSRFCSDYGVSHFLRTEWRPLDLMPGDCFRLRCPLVPPPSSSHRVTRHDFVIVPTELLAGASFSFGRLPSCKFRRRVITRPIIRLCSCIRI